ncbi:MAG: hypothetical protein GXP55_07075 [Deltaproteobacteria bacterium]|nr:hypothetical protein [Deltaproteobacteria bacterium]
MMLPRVNRRYLAVGLLSLLACCGSDRRGARVPPESRCGEITATPRTIEVGAWTYVEFRTLCEVDDSLESLRLRLPDLDLGVVGTQQRQFEPSEITLEADGTLTTRLELMPTSPTAAGGNLGAVSIVDRLRPSLELASGMLYMHDADATLVERYAAPVTASCFLTCRDGRGRVQRGPFEGGVCSCDPPQLLKLGAGHVELHASVNDGSLDVLRLDRLPDGTLERTGVSVWLGTRHTSFARQELSVIESESGLPFALWWGVTSEPDAHFDSVIVPILEHRLGESRLLKEDALDAHPLAQLAAMELLRGDSPEAPPHPVWLYVEHAADGSLRWNAAQLFTGSSGLDASFSEPAATWLGVTPESFLVGASFLGITRSGDAAGDARRGVGSAEFVSWSLRRSAGRPEQVVLTTLRSGSAEQSAEYVASPWRHCWQLGPAPGGFVLTERPRTAGGGLWGQAYFVSSAGRALHLAPLLDSTGRRPLAGAATTGACALGTPSRWQGLPDWRGDQGSLWMAASPNPGLPATWLSYDLQGSVGVPPGTEDPILPQLTIPLTVDALPETSSGELRTWASVASTRLALTHVPQAASCADGRSCAFSLVRARLGGFVAYDLGLAYTGEGSPQLALLADGEADPVARLALQDAGLAARTSWVLGPGPLGLFAMFEDGADLWVARLQQGDAVAPLGVRLATGGVPMGVFVGPAHSIVWLVANRSGEVEVQEGSLEDLRRVADGGSDQVSVSPLGVVDGLPTGARSSLRVFSATAPAFSLPGEPVAEVADARWVAWVERRSDPCAAPRLVVASVDRVEGQEVDVSRVGHACEGGDRPVAMGHFLGRDGQQWISVRREEGLLTLRLWYLGAQGLMVHELASLPLPATFPSPLVWVGDLDSDGLTDVFVDRFDADGVLVGLSDGQGGLRGLQLLPGVSEHLVPTRGSVPDTVSEAPLSPGGSPLVTNAGRLQRL